MFPIVIPPEFVLLDVDGVEFVWEDVLSSDRAPDDDEEGEITPPETLGVKFVASDKDGLLCDTTMAFPSLSAGRTVVLRPTACALVDTGAAAIPLACGVIVAVLVTVLERERRGPILDELDDSLRC